MLAMQSDALARIASVLAQRAADLLQARVSVVDEAGTVLAASDSTVRGSPLSAQTTDDALRVPVMQAARSGELVITGIGDGESISPRLAHALAELLVQQSVAPAVPPDQVALKDEFIHTLLRCPGGADADLIRQGQILGMDLTLPRAVILIDAAEHILAPDDSTDPEMREAQARRRARFVIASVVSFFHLPSDTICAYIGEGEVAILKASTTRDLVAWTDRDDLADDWEPSWANLTALKRAAAGLLRRLRHDTGHAISIGIGRYHPGIRGLARSYQDAQAALSLGRRFHGANQVHCLDGLGSAAFVGVADQGTKVDLASHLLSPLDHEPELLCTLTAFFAEDCSPSSTASRLAIHRNTLSYRLDKVTALTGLDPRRFDDACQIHLALLLRAFQAPLV